jgi:quinol monooxygenase YgiN
MEKLPVAVVIHYRTKPDTAAEAANELAKLIATVRELEPLCSEINLHIDENDPTRILLYERWANRDAYFGDHMQTPHLTAFREHAAEFFAGPPEISVWETKVEV